MLVVSNDFHTAFKNPEREIVAKVTINKVEYHEDKIKEIKYTTGAYSGEKFQLGSVQSASVKIIFTEIVENLKELDEIKVEVGIKISGSDDPSNINYIAKVGSSKVGKTRLISYVPDRYEFVPLGTFYISDRVDPNRNDNTTIIEARDGFIFMEGDYESELSYPSKIANIGLEIANKSGIEIDPVSFNHLSDIRISKPEGYTFRQAMGIIAQYYIGYACFDRDGKLAVRRLVDPRFKITPNDYFLKGLTKNELIYQPKGIVCKVIKKIGETTETTTLQAGSTNGPQISIENNTMTQSLLDNIFDLAKNINFYPISLKWRGNPAVEAGDWVELTDLKGTKFKSPVLNYTLIFDGGLSSTISADSKSQSAGVVEFKGPLQQKLDELDYRVDAAGKNNVYDGMDEPKYPKEGDIWFKKNGPDDEIWVYQKLEDGSFDWVMTTSTRMDEEIQEKIDNATPSDEIIKTINLSSELDGNEWLKIIGAKIWLTDETKIDNAIITSAMISEIDAGKIRTGTLDASKITVTNLNASSISTGNLSSINISGSKITGSEIISESSDGSRITVDSGHLSVFDTNRDLSVQLGTIYPGGKKNNGLSFKWSDLWEEESTNSDRDYFVIGVDYLKAIKFNITALEDFESGGGSTSKRYYSKAVISKDGVFIADLTMGGNQVEGKGSITNGQLYGTTVNRDFTISNGSNVQIYSSLNMNGYSIYNQSDIRLKENIADTQINGINETKKLNFVEFNRKQFYQSKEIGVQPNNEKELGLIAQYSPFLAVNKGEDNYLSLDVNKQIMLNSLTNKELILLIEKQERRIKNLENSILIEEENNEK